MYNTVLDITNLLPVPQLRMLVRKLHSKLELDTKPSLLCINFIKYQIKTQLKQTTKSRM